LTKTSCQYIRQKYNLLIGERMAERVKINIGSAYPLHEEKIMTVRGAASSRPAGIVDISSIEIREALSGSVSLIVDLVKAALDQTPPEVVADLMEQGICVGGRRRVAAGSGTGSPE